MTLPHKNGLFLDSHFYDRNLLKPFFMKTFYGILLFAATLLFTACGSDSRMISGQELPTEAQQFISTYFPGAKVQLAQKDRELDGTEYKVKLDNGFALEFNGKGQWKQVNGTPQSIPDQLIPTFITEYVSRYFPEQTILVLEQEKRGYKIIMLNAVELEFDKQGNLTEWDD